MDVFLPDRAGAGSLGRGGDAFVGDIGENGGCAADPGLCCRIFCARGRAFALRCGS